METIISSLITGVIAIFVCVVNSNVQMKKADIEQDKKLMEIDAKYQQALAIITCKIDELDKKQTIHNGVVERVYQLEKAVTVLDVQVRDKK